MRPCDDPDGFWLRAVKDALDYDPETGVFRWRIARGKRRRSGDIAGCLDTRSVYQIYFNGKNFKGHRIAWAIAYGTWPSGVIDHINRNSGDNRLANLRDVTRSLNARNCKLHRDNSSGVAGIHRHRSGWVIRVSKKYIGCSKHFHVAVEMRRAAEIAAGGFITALSVDLPLIVND